MLYVKDSMGTIADTKIKSYDENDTASDSEIQQALEVRRLQSNHLSSIWPA